VSGYLKKSMVEEMKDFIQIKTSIKDLVGKNTKKKIQGYEESF
jgi:predicted transcriptional regulator